MAGAGVAAWLLYSFALGRDAGSPEAAEGIFLLAMMLGFPLSVLGSIGFAVHPLVGWALIILSIMVMWGCVGAAISTIGALAASEIQERWS
ncbi:MAG TPA: hypothetical protein VE913_24720 [Longimicrobium sp.]|nr:hypothetical protein [Longimicrobium sp.]